MALMELMLYSLIPFIELETFLEQIVIVYMPLLLVAMATRTLKHYFKNRTGWPFIRGDMRGAIDEHKRCQSPHPCAAVGRYIFISLDKHKCLCCEVVMQKSIKVCS
jgi:hypothetical protein